MYLDETDLKALTLSFDKGEFLTRDELESLENEGIIESYHTYDPTGTELLDSGMRLTRDGKQYLREVKNDADKRAGRRKNALHCVG